MIGINPRSFRRFAPLVVAGTVALTASADAGVYRLRRMVVVGDSILAGFGSGGLVTRGATGQRDDAPALIARQAHVKFPQATMSGPGVPPPLVIDDRNGNGVLDAGEIARRAKGVGFRKAPSQASRNLAVPGESLESVFETLSADDVAKGLVKNDISGRDILKFLILGLPLRDDAVSQLTRADDLGGSIMLVWLGNNDVLPMATRTNPAAATDTPMEFGTKYRQFLNRLVDSGTTDFVVANLPDVTQIAALRPASTDVTSCTAADNSVVPVAPDALLSIGLDPAKLPVPPCGKVLDDTERATARATVMAYNVEIAAAIEDVAVNRNVNIAAVDMFALFDRIATTGYDVYGDGQLVLTNQYLGGLFSLDGVHPTRTGQALLANAFIDAINLKFGEIIPPVDVGAIAAKDPLVNNRYRSTSPPPFGLLGNQNVDVEGALDNALDDLRDAARDVFFDLRRKIRDVFRKINPF